MTDPTTFRTVLRGYDPTQVEHAWRELAATADTARHEAAERTVALTKLESAYEEAQRQIADKDAALAQLHQESIEASRRAATPTFADLGERIGHILSLADEEAASIRDTAHEDALGTRQAADTDAASIRAEADRYAQEVRSKADADVARLVEDARKQADDIRDHADREASARREEAEALYERQRAAAAAAAADFETTLAARRDKAAQDFQSALDQHHASLTAEQERADTLRAESTKAHEDAQAEAAGLLERARQEAAATVAAAKEQADRVKRESDRELAALTARRDSITAQLANVRQMLATLGGAAAVAHHDEVSGPGTDPAGQHESDPVELEGDPEGGSASQPDVAEATHDPAEAEESTKDARAQS